MKQGWMRRTLNIFMDGLTSFFSPSSVPAGSGGACFKVPPPAGKLRGHLLWTDARNKITVSVPLVCCGYLPADVQCLLKLRDAGLSPEMMAQVMQQADMYQLN